jgi:hypothetical protein
MLLSCHSTPVIPHEPNQQFSWSQLDFLSGPALRSLVLSDCRVEALDLQHILTVLCTYHRLSSMLLACNAAAPFYLILCNICWLINRDAQS